MRALVVLAGACAVAVASSCGPVAGPVRVEALVLDRAAEGGARLGDVVLDSVVDLSRGKGELFDVVGDLVVDEAKFVAALEDGDSYEAIVGRMRGDRDVPVAPRMSWDGERWIAEDFETLFYFSTFASFEKAWRFYDDVVGDESAATSERSIVGLYARAVSTVLQVPVLTSDNAAYASMLDGWLTLRVGVQEGVPLAMHDGVIGHEFQHRVFFHNVFGADGWDAFAARFSSTLSAEDVRAIVVMSGCDEGLADIFTIGMNEDPELLVHGFATAGGAFAVVAARRDVEGAFADQATFDGLEDGTLPDASFLQACGATRDGANFTRATFDFYCIGTVLARALWDGAARDVAVLRADVLPATNRALAGLGPDMRAGARFDVAALLQGIAAGTDGPLRAQLCASFADRFARDAARVDACF